MLYNLGELPGIYVLSNVLLYKLTKFKIVLYVFIQVLPEL